MCFLLRLANNDFPHCSSFQIFHASDAELEEHALKALKALLQTIYSDEEGKMEIADEKSSGVAWTLCDLCLLELKDADKTNATPATKILSRATSASGMVCLHRLMRYEEAKWVRMSLGLLARYIVRKSFSHLLRIYRLPQERQQRPALLGAMASLLTGLRGCPVQEPAEPLLDYREEILSIVTTNLHIKNTRQQALECLLQLIQLPRCLSADEMVYALRSITDLLIQPELEDSNAIGSIALDGLVEISPTLPLQIDEVVLPPLYHLLPNQAPSRQDHTGIDRYRMALAALAALCILPQLFQSLLIRLLSRLESICFASIAESDRIQYGQQVKYAHHILTTFRIVIEKKAKAKHMDLMANVNDILPRIYRLFILPSVKPVETRSITAETQLIEDAGRIITILVQQMDMNTQKTLAYNLKVAYFDGHPESLLGEYKFRSEGVFLPFSVS